MAGKFNIKCGVIDADGRISQDKGFKFFTWTATSNTSVENQFTLSQRVKELYPDMKEPHTYQIVCIDEQNERVVLQPDDFKETIAAFLCLQSKSDNRPIRICIQTLTVVEPGNCDGQIHYGIRCSGCNKKPIVGFRYDCTQCPNYILCGRCDTAGLHREHNFLRISKPVQVPSFFMASEKHDSMTSIPSLQYAIQNLGDRLVNQMNTFQLSVTNTIFNMTENVRNREGNLDAEVEDTADTVKT